MHRSKLAAAAGIAAVVAGCGSSGPQSVTPAAYVKSICSAVAPFESDVQARSNALSSTKLTDPIQGKQMLQDFLGAISRDSDLVLTRLKHAGAPSVRNGKAIAAAVVSAFAQLKRALQQAFAQAGVLPTSSAAAFRTGAQALGSAVSGSMQNIGAGLSGLKDPALVKAAAKEPACQSLQT
jgi:hypothetical protein